MARVLVIFIPFLLSNVISLKAQTTNFQVYSLFVMNIAKYSSWPDNGAEFQIVVFGNSKVYDELSKYSDRGINGRKVQVTKVESPGEIGTPHIVYLSDNKSSQIDDVLNAVKGKPIMIVTEREGLYKKGAGFSFLITDENHLRFDINMSDLEKRGIKISKNLTGMAHEVL